MTARAQHTPEPWYADDSPACQSEVRFERGDTSGSIGFVLTCEPGSRSTEQSEADARRIVACVNALAGMDPEAVAGLISEAQHLADGADMCGAFYPGQNAGALRAALAKLKGGAA